MESLERLNILNAAADATAGPRNRDYGDPFQNMSRTADLIEAYLCAKYDVALHLVPEDAANILVLVKMARAFERHVKDNYVDAAAYIAIAGEVRKIQETVK